MAVEPQELEAQPVGEPTDDLQQAYASDGVLEVRDEGQRIISMRLVQWGQVARTKSGWLETYRRGAFRHIKPSDVVLRLEHEGPPAGSGVALEERDDGPYMDFRVSRTPRGDEILTLAKDRVTRGVSVSYAPGSTLGLQERSSEGSILAITKCDLREVSTTWRPTFSGAEIMAVRSMPEEGNISVPEAVVTPDVPATPEPPTASQLVDLEPVTGAIRGLVSRFDKVDTAITALEERARGDFSVPSPNIQPVDKFGRGDWAKLVLRMMAGERIPPRELEERVAAELITSDNLGVVPEQMVGELRGFIDTARPFLESTRELNAPAAGITFNVPVIGTRPTVGVQANEKDELTSTETAITSEPFTPLTIGGYGDISLQLLKRSDPSYLDLYVELLAEAYAIMADDKAVDALLAASGVHSGGALDPEAASFGAAWRNGTAVSKRLTPDTIWLSSQAVGAFIDAKADGTNAPLYSNIAANFTAGGGVGGTINGLRPVHVPALDDESVDVIVGPSRGFAWAEDGTFTLQVDNPALAGRDVALVGMVWFMPLYPAAFTKYTMAGS
jgi:HK97 family phage prohead protease